MDARRATRRVIPREGVSTGWLPPPLPLRGRTVGHRLDVAEQAGEGDANTEQQERRQPGELLHGGGEHRELAGEHAERRKPGDGYRADQEPLADDGLSLDEAADMFQLLMEWPPFP